MMLVKCYGQYYLTSCNTPEDLYSMLDDFDSSGKTNVEYMKIDRRTRFAVPVNIVRSLDQFWTDSNRLSGEAGADDYVMSTVVRVPECDERCVVTSYLQDFVSEMFPDGNIEASPRWKRIEQDVIKRVEAKYVRTDAQA